MRDYVTLIPMLASSVKVPLMIDSTEPECIAEALKRYPGRCIVNSINLEDGGKRLAKVCTLAKKYGAAVVALTIDERGMAMTADEKVALAGAFAAWRSARTRCATRICCSTR